MQSNITLPTDNVYKFYAFLGILLMLTAAIMFFMRNQYYNSMAFDRFVPMENLKAKGVLKNDEKLELYLYEEKERIARSELDFELLMYFFGFFIGVGFTFYGFRHWHTKIQPQQDRLLDLEIRKLENELKSFDKSV
ncbi:hypothetical protein [Idiomarina xiamenensis]|uniref:Uncharacterized protein n=1 Tax=Idiomarina xiamenensis 10-D-4 TaxID=740709 RepID=K2KLT9_9GAMM|nr:hypothetical protein [Idiomarina xiamenensis]EKE87532.1 hypothetical protein A10D4_00520 [Idiomarina xiamenensis 10-D-4]